MNKTESKRKRTRTVEVPGRLVVQAMNEEWIWWAKDLARHCRTDVSKVIESALSDYAKARGFTTEAPHRNP